MNFTKWLFTFFALLMFTGCDSGMDPEPEGNILEQMIYSFTFDRKSYTIVKEAHSWLEAASFAKKIGGYLAEINSEEEQSAIFMELVSNANIYFDDTDNQYGYAAVWLGGNDLTTEGAWVWNGDNNDTEEQFWEGAVDGRAVNDLYNNWGNEPDNNGDQDALCIGLEDTPINAAGKWTDLNGSLNSLFFVIEYD